MSRQDNVGSRALEQLFIAFAVGVFSFFMLMLGTSAKLALAGGWIVVVGSLLALIWLSVWRLDGAGTKAHVEQEDTDRTLRDGLLIAASLASLGALALLLVEASHAQGAQKVLHVLAGLGVIIMSWALVHTLFSLRYARLYFAGSDGGIDFNSSAAPTYRDFAYLGFTIGMTFQVSDTVIKSPKIRGVVLRQALLSFVFGTAIIATTINAVASLTAS